MFKAPNFKDDGAVEAFAQRFLAEGIDRERQEFRGPVGLTDMMAEYADVDIALDPVLTTVVPRPCRRCGWACRWSSRPVAILCRAWGPAS